MAFDISDIKSSFRERPLRILMLGKQKSGKSTLASQAPNPVFLPIKGEEGIDALKSNTFPVIGSYADLMDAIDTLYTKDHNFKTVVIDSASTLEPLMWKECCRVNGGVASIEKVLDGYYKGYTEVLNQWTALQNGLDALRNEKNMWVIIVGHVTVKSFKDPMSESYDQYVFNIHKYASAKLCSWADGIMFLQRKFIIKKEDVGFGKTKNRAIAFDSKENQPKLYTQERPSHPGGGRGNWRYLPYEMEVDWQAFENEFFKERTNG